MTAAACSDAALRRGFRRGSVCGGDPERPLTQRSMFWTLGEG
jgi:hypothetical protein